jgi:hypothetical protein
MIWSYQAGSRGRNKTRDRYFLRFAMTKLLGLSVVIILMGSAAATARVSRAERSSLLPPLDINATCKDIMKIDPQYTVNYSSCMTEEVTARGELEREWRAFSASEQEECLHLVSPPALESYLTLQECLHTSRDAKAYAKSSSRRANRPRE